MTYKHVITKLDHDNLSDIAWWIKGYLAGDTECPFCEDHVHSIRKFLENTKVDLRAEIRRQNDSDTNPKE